MSLSGLNDEQIAAARKQYGLNSFDHQEQNHLLQGIWDMLKDPMFILLLVAATIYFITGDYGDGVFMVFAIVVVAAISLYQESRSRNAIDALRKLSQPKCKVIRNGTLTEILREEIVVGDLVQMEEGSFIPADGVIVQSNDFSVNESILTGESMTVFKSESSEDTRVFQGTIVATGLAICRITAVGNQTELGRIGKSLTAIEEEKTPLQIQIGHFVQKMSLLGLAIFAVVWGVNYYHSREVLGSLLKALTLAMSIIPEEIPVAFTSFMALGAWRLLKMGIIVKQTKTVETLGSATVICTDKTGTITENRMTLAQWYTLSDNNMHSPADPRKETDNELLSLSMWSSEPIPFDAMEIALHEAYEKLEIDDDRPYYELIHEYPLSGNPPMMTHIFQNKSGHRIIAAKGAPEAILSCASVSEAQRKQIDEALAEMTLKGYRVLGVGAADLDGVAYPKTQQEFSFQFKGLVAFYDPPKHNIKAVFETFYRAGIDVKIVTGDSAATTATIAGQIGFRNSDLSLNGDALMEMDDETLQTKVKNTGIFTRMFPDAKLKIIRALKDNGQIVAMTGDGVNDGPALKSAHIGIAMGHKGSEIAKEAANLILVDDDFSKMCDAIAMGRKIYVNLKKAIQYIISIHIPIILVVFIPLILGWVYPNIFSPVHIIFLEIIMGPTCSIIYENEPMESDLMLHKPRPLSTTFFKWNEIAISIVQGLAITVGLLAVYQLCVADGCNEDQTRTTVFLTLIIANTFLTLVNRSFHFSLWKTLRYRNPLIPLMIGATLAVTALLQLIPVCARFFQFEMVSQRQLLLSLTAGILSVLWFEVYKWILRLRERSGSSSLERR